MDMDRKPAFLLVVLLAGMLWPMGRIWEMWHRTPSTCPPCATGAARRPLAETGTCGYIGPMLNATCPACRRVWYDAKAPVETLPERLLSWLPRSRVPTVFSDPSVCAREGVYANHFWPAERTPGAPGAGPYAGLM